MSEEKILAGYNASIASAGRKGAMKRSNKNDTMTMSQEVV